MNQQHGRAISAVLIEDPRPDALADWHVTSTDEPVISDSLARFAAIAT